MAQLFDAAMNWSWFSEYIGDASAIVLRDIVELPEETDIVSAKRALHPGTRVHEIIRRSLTVKLVFSICTQDPALRAQYIRTITTWLNNGVWMGNGSWLQLSTRPGQILRVRVKEYPSLGSSLKWTDDVTVVLTAYEQPYWEEEEGYHVVLETTLNETSGFYTASGEIQGRGQVEKVPFSSVGVNFLSMDKPLTTIQITAGDTVFLLEGMNIEPGGNMNHGLWIRYNESDILTITDDYTGEHLLKYRTAESSDDLLFSSIGKTKLSVQADAHVSVNFVAGGRWL